jgi:hypothetical protein
VAVSKGIKLMYYMVVGEMNSMMGVGLGMGIMMEKVDMTYTEVMNYEKRE